MIMRNIVYYTFLAACLTLAPLSVNERLNAEETTPSFKDGIAAKVNGEIITQSEVEVMASQLRKDKSVIIKGLIEGRLFYQAAMDEGTQVTDKELDRRLNRTMYPYGGKRKFEEEILKVYNISYEQYREELRMNMVREKYVMVKMSGTKKAQQTNTEMDLIVDTFVSPKEIRDYFEEHRSDYTGKPKVKIEQIILKFEDEIGKNSKKAIGEALLSELAKGKPIEELIASYSEASEEEKAGFDRYLTEDDFPKSIAESIFALEIGEKSSLVETEKDIRIIQVIDKIKPVESIDSPELQSRIKEILRRKKTFEGMNNLKAQLIKKADIWVDPSLKLDWQPAPAK